MTAAPRPLIEGELVILRMIQEAWGPQNAEAEVFFMEDNPTTPSVSVVGAWISVKAPDGTRRGLVNLTNTAAWYKDGTFSHADVLRAVRGPNWSEGHAL